VSAALAKLDPATGKVVGYLSPFSAAQDVTPPVYLPCIAPPPPPLPGTP
jgi:hypothetical protein